MDRLERELAPSASYSLTLRLRIPQRPGSFASVAAAIGAAGGLLGAIDLVRIEDGVAVRDVTVACSHAGHGEAVLAAVRSLEGVSVDSVSDRTFLLHLGGKIEVTPKVPVRTRDDLSMAYTRGSREGLDADDQRQYRRGSVRRHRRPGPR